jgi:L-amino acid N-acyltransferase YncA
MSGETYSPFSRVSRATTIARRPAQRFGPSRPHQWLAPGRQRPRSVATEPLIPGARTSPIMVVRDLDWRDFNDLVGNYLGLYEGTRTDPDIGIPLFSQPPSLGEEAQWFAGLFRRVSEGTTVAVVAEEGGRAVGLCTIDQRGPHPETQHVGTLGILIAPARRGRGIGRLMIQRAIERSRGKFESIQLSVLKSNVRARGLYESLGFRSWGVSPKAVLRKGRYTDLEFMSLDLQSGERPTPG